MVMLKILYMRTFDTLTILMPQFYVELIIFLINVLVILNLICFLLFAGNQNFEDSDDSSLPARRWSFYRQHRYDIKKPGPTYFFHEPDSNEVRIFP